MYPIYLHTHTHPHTHTPHTHPFTPTHSPEESSGVGDNEPDVLGVAVVTHPPLLIHSGLRQNHHLEVGKREREDINNHNLREKTIRIEVEPLLMATQRKANCNNIEARSQMNSLCTKQPLNKAHLCIRATTLFPKGVRYRGVPCTVHVHAMLTK